MGSILTNEDLRKLISAAAALGKKELVLHGQHFEAINLRNESIPLSLDLDDSIIDGDFILANANFGGNYISLDRTIINGSISLSGLKVKPNFNGFGFYLRGATVWAPIHLDYTKINTLAVYACNFESNVTGLLKVAGTVIDRIFVQPEKGELAEIQRLKKEAQLKRKTGEFTA